MGRSFLLLATVLSLSLSACGHSLDCSPRSPTITGDLATDIVGTWGSFGIDSPVVVTFRADGTATIDEEPNMYAPSGNHSVVSWSVSGSTLTYGGRTAQASISSSGLVLTEMGGPPRTHPPLTCTGLAP